MAHEQTPITVEKDTWVQLTNGDVTEISFQVLDGEIELRRGGTAAPGLEARGWIYPGGTGREKLALADISVAQGSRVWAKGRRAANSTVLVDHA
ncbi:hypothetical protein [Leisingera aquaemixtae]|uniref:Uncharacterized protein n=1 Tax=Leisingera aquaemixtae TaxID=1396826 RepID=A0A0P1H9X9_9RHOB|nr:hypothetical protein [Leisingera aquaemixtae]CUH99860.1 hypothetical protein PHA8399_01986 [Leisingera aquaemixtae]